MEFGDDIKSFRFSWLFYRTSYQGKQSYDIIATVAKVLDPSKDMRCVDAKKTDPVNCKYISRFDTSGTSINDNSAKVLVVYGIKNYAIKICCNFVHRLRYGCLITFYTKNDKNCIFSTQFFIGKTLEAFSNHFRPNTNF